MAEQTPEQAVTPEQRVRLLMEVVDSPSLSDIYYDKRFKSEEWPRTGYALQRSDLKAVLDELDKVRNDFVDLEEAYDEADCDDVDRLCRENEALRKENDAYKTLMESTARDIERQEQMIRSLRINGGEHWFTYGYQKVVDPLTGSYVDFCSVCDKPRDDPSHFGNGVVAVPSTEVQKVRDDVLRVLVGMGVTEDRAREVITGLFSRVLPKT